MENRDEKINVCQQSLYESLTFKGDIDIDQAVVRIVKNQYSIMESLYLILEDMKSKG